MGQMTDNVDGPTRQHTMTAADHYRTAAMHHAAAHAVLADSLKEEGVDPWKADQQYERHMREAELSVQLANARNGALELLIHERAYREVTNDGTTQRQQNAIEVEVTAWAATIAPAR